MRCCTNGSPVSIATRSWHNWFTPASSKQWTKFNPILIFFITGCVKGAEPSFWRAKWRAKMAKLETLRKSLDDLNVKVENDAVLERCKEYKSLPKPVHFCNIAYCDYRVAQIWSVVWEIGRQHDKADEDLADEWISYSTNSSGCELTIPNLEAFSCRMQPKPRPHRSQQQTPRRSSSRSSGSSRPSGGDRTSSYSRENLPEIL